MAQNRFKDGKKMLELRRMAISEECPKNTASRIIKVMTLLIKKKFTDIIRLISYQDCEVHTGTIYKASGWKIASETPFIDWTTKNRKRSKIQSGAKKNRWEFQISRKDG